MYSPLPPADEVHVISDLHLGGKPGFQILQSADALAAYIRSLDTAAPLSRVLVINGDFIDFLAEESSRTFDPRNAVDKLDRIAGDEQFRKVFSALHDFLSHPNHRLAITLGNHDIELAMPWVRDHLLKLLANGRDDAASRCVFALEGHDLLLNMAGPLPCKVLCVHGNEVDDWNVVDHDKLRRLGRDLLRGHSTNEYWNPNAGSRMVVEVMNEIKRDYPFVDLLKPENEAVLPVLLALRPSAAPRLRDIASIMSRKSLDKAKMRMGFLGDGSGDDADDSMQLRPSADFQPASRALHQDKEKLAAELMERVEASMANGTLPSHLVDSATSKKYLGFWGAVGAVARLDTVEALRQSLDHLESDRSFVLDDRDDKFRAMDSRVSVGIDFLVTGHTHLPRAIVREAGLAYYFNTGTWAHVFRLKHEIRRDAEQFKKWFHRLRGSSAPALALDVALEPQLPHVAVIRRDGNGVTGELFTVATTPPYSAKPVPNSRFCRN